MRLNRNRPELSVVVVNTVPVARLVAFTCAPEITAPGGSVTVAEIEPFNTCAALGTAVTARQVSHKQSPPQVNNRAILFIIFSIAFTWAELVGVPEQLIKH